ncbi:MAG: M23 family metallopeptidase [Alistipes onderdonkii]
MRPAHFHAGIDIKTDGAEGKPLVAVADGYVSRVSLGAYGYGRAVYLTLHNGTTAVYGHLQRFRKDIEERVREERHARRSNSVNLWFGPDTWPVKQGDVVGYSEQQRLVDGAAPPLRTARHPHAAALQRRKRRDHPPP